MGKSKILTPLKTSSSLYTEEDLLTIAKYPATTLGKLSGFPDFTTLHDRWVLHCWKGDGRHKKLTASRGCFKTSACTIVGTIWWLLFHPNESVLILRKSFEDASSVLTAICKIMEMPEIRELFAFAHGEAWTYSIKRKDCVDFSFRRSAGKDLSITAKGLDGSLTGVHCSAAILDDVVTIKDKLSAAERKRTELILRDVYTSIIDRGRGVTILGTPWHPLDALSTIPIEDSMSFNIYECNLFTPEQIAEKRKTETAVGWASQYEMRHISGESNPFADLKETTWQTTGIDKVYAHVDTAYGKGDFCAVTIGAKRFNGDIQIVGLCTKLSISDWLPFLVDKLKFYRVKKVFVEDNCDKGWTSSRLKERGLLVGSYLESTQKVHKISTFITEAWDDCYFDTNQSDEQYLAMISGWDPTTDYDDAPDSLASLIRACFAKSKSKANRWEL